MSKEYYHFENEKGDISFLAGVVDVISDYLEMALDFAYALEADIFYVKDNNIALLDNAIKTRLHNYNQELRYNIPKEKIDRLHFQLNELKTDVHNYFFEQMKPYSSKSNLSDKVSEFLGTLSWHLGEPLGIYAPPKMPDKNINILGKIYLYEAWKYFFVSYEDYVVLVLFGTVE